MQICHKTFSQAILKRSSVLQTPVFLEKTGVSSKTFLKHSPTVTKWTLLFVILSALLPPTLFSQSNKLNLKLQYPVLKVESQVWIGTPVGLYQYNSTDKFFKRFSTPTTNPNPPIARLYYHNEWLWCVLDSGLTALHIRLNESLLFNTDKGLPSDRIRGLDFQDDYVWIATDGGVARYDLLTEEWEVFDESRGLVGGSAKDLVVNGDQVWMITKEGFAEYDPQFEKWRYFRVEGDTTVVLKRLFLVGEEIWFVSDHGLIRFNPKLETRQSFYQEALLPQNLIEVFIEGSIVWAFTRTGLFYYDQETNVWREFEGNSYLQNSTLTNASVDPEQFWFLTSQNVLVWDRTDKNWEMLDYASGLSSSTFVSVDANGGMVFLFNPQSIDYRTSEKESWQKFKISPGKAKSGIYGKQFLKNLFDNEEGGSISLGRYEWGFEGSRLTWIQDYEQRWDARGESVTDITSGERLDVKSHLSLGESRTITGFYNNVDYSETMYGIRYRSRDNSLLQEFNWGDSRREPGNIPFGETASVFGSNIWLQAGRKTEIFKRSLFSFKAQAGELRSQKTYEVYQGDTDAVYDLQQPQSSYAFEASFNTQLSLIQLKHTNLVRGSEVVELDGITMNGGSDYVLDYTNGTLVFVREGLVTSGTRIEIRYEYYLTGNNEQIHSATMNWSPSDNFYLQGDWLQSRSNKQNMANDSLRVNLFSAHSQLRKKLGKMDMKVIPGVAYCWGKNRLAAGSFEGFISSSRFRLQSVYQNYSKDYKNLFRQQSVVGEVQTNQQWFASVDVLDYLRMTGDWKKIRGFANSEETSPADQSSNVGFLFHRQRWPGWQFNYQQFNTNSPYSRSKRSFIQNLWEYQFPELLSRKILLKQMKVEALLQMGQQSGLALYDSDKQKFQQGYLRLNAMLSERFQTTLFYRRNDLNNILSTSDKVLSSRFERLLVDISHEQWRVAQLNLRVENLLDQYFHRDSDRKNASLRQFSQLNMRLSPGQIRQSLSPLYFEMNVNHSFNTSGETEALTSDWLWQVVDSKRQRLENNQRIWNFFFKNELRSGIKWLLYSIVELNDQKQTQDTSLLESRFWRWTEKVDLKIGFKTHTVIQYRQYYQDSGYGKKMRYFEPSSWLEHHWTSNFQNIINLLYRRSQNDEGEIRDIVRELEARYDLILRRDQLLGIRHLEILESFSGTRRHATGYDLSRSYLFSCTSAIDLYPFHSMIIRLRLDLKQYLDRLDKNNDYFNLLLDAKITLRF